MYCSSVYEVLLVLVMAFSMINECKFSCGNVCTLPSESFGPALNYLYKFQALVILKIWYTPVSFLGLERKDNQEITQRD